MKIPYNLPLFVRQDVHDFAALMERNLQKKAGKKTGYAGGHPLAVFAKLGEELGEVATELAKFYAWDGAKYGPMKKSDHDPIIHECADLGNVAMMLINSMLELRADAVEG